MSSSELCLEN